MKTLREFDILFPVIDRYRLFDFETTPVISLTTIAFFALQLTLPIGEDIAGMPRNPALMLLDSFLSDWTLRCDLYPLKGVEYLAIPTVIRYFKECPAWDFDRLNNARRFELEDIPIIRERGSFYNATDTTFLE